MIGSCTNSPLPYPSAYGNGPTAAGGAVWSPVASGATAGETQTAIDDSGDEGIVTSIGGAPAESPTYSAAGLLNSFVQAGTPLADVSSTGPYGGGDDSGLAAAVQSEDGAVLGAEDADGGSAAPPAGNYQSVWGNTLQSDPGMAATVAGDALDQGLVSTLSVMA
jgi:hypothetical protein